MTRSEGALRVGVIGCGGVAQMMHLPTLAERPDLFHITALANRDAATLAAVSDRYHVPPAQRFSDWQDLVRQPDVELVLVANSGSHLPQVMRALMSGKHVFVEKPLAYNREEFNELMRASRARPNQLVMVGCHKRYDPAFLRAEKLVGAMTDLRYVDVSVIHPDDADFRRHHAILPLDRTFAVEGASESAMQDEVNAEPARTMLNVLLGRSDEVPVSHRIASLLFVTGLIHDVNLVGALLGSPERIVSSHVWHGGLGQTHVARFGQVAANLTFVLTPGLPDYREVLRFIGSRERITLRFSSPYLRHVPTRLTVERVVDGSLRREEHGVGYDEAFRLELHEAHRWIRRGGSYPVTDLEDAGRDLTWAEQVVRTYQD